MSKMIVVQSLRSIQGVKGLVVLVLAILSVLSLVESILINPSMEDHYNFSPMSGSTEYSFFMNHPPVLSEDEQFLLVLSTYMLLCRIQLLLSMVLSVYYHFIGVHR